MLATGLVAIDSTILATAVPSVVADLGGFSQFPWLFSIYLLAQAVTVPLYGKFADLVGRKPMMMLGIAIFLVASILCGLAWSMVSLIVFRALQGLGAGAVLPMGQTIIGDVYSVAERAKVTGYVAGVWAASSVIGPTLGGIFSDYISWRWIFFVNIPIAIAAMLVLHRSFHESVERRHHRIDYAGAGTARRRRLAAHPRVARGRRRVVVGLPRQPGGAVRRGRAAGRVRVRRVAGRRAGAALVGVPRAGTGRRQLDLALRRRDPDRADGIRAALRPGGARPQRRGGGLRGRRADPRAGRSRPRSPAGSTCGSGSATAPCWARRSRSSARASC